MIKSMARVTLLVAFLSSLSLAVPVFADETVTIEGPNPTERDVVVDPTPEPGSQFVSFKSTDTDGDGFVSEAEAEGIIKDFAVADANGDGRLDPAEFAMEPKVSAVN